MRCYVRYLVVSFLGPSRLDDRVRPPPKHTPDIVSLVDVAACQELLQPALHNEGRAGGGRVAALASATAASVSTLTSTERTAGNGARQQRHYNTWSTV